MLKEQAKLFAMEATPVASLLPFRRQTLRRQFRMADSLKVSLALVVLKIARGLFISDGQGSTPRCQSPNPYPYP